MSDDPQVPDYPTESECAERCVPIERVGIEEVKPPMSKAEKKRRLNTLRAELADVDRKALAKLEKLLRLSTAIRKLRRQARSLERRMNRIELA